MMEKPFLDQLVVKCVTNYWYILGVFCLVGIVVSLLCLFKLLIWIYQLLSRRQFVWLVDGDKWAVVTGATDGIGYQFAVRLAQKGYNLMLLSRNEEKLQQTKQSIYQNQQQLKHNRHNNNNTKIQIETLAVDFSELNIYDRIKQFLNVNERDIFVLVNNVGTNTKYPDTFLNSLKNEPGFCQRLINVNLISATKMTELILPSMMYKKCGLILNVSSSTSLIPVPLASVYSATKAYIRSLSIALAEECRSNNVYVYCLTTGWTHTKLTGHIKRIAGTDPQTYVESALNSVQNMNNFESAGFWLHSLTQYSFWTTKCLISDQLFYRLQHWGANRIKEKFHKNDCLTSSTKSSPC